MSEAIHSDLRFALRSIVRRPAFSLGIIATLALVIGASTGIFSAIYGIVFRALPYKDPDRLVFISESNHTTGAEHLGVTKGAFPIIASSVQSLEIAAACPAFSFLRGTGDTVFTQRIWGTQESIHGLGCSSQLFQTLGASPLIGRTFSAEEEKASSVDEENPDQSAVHYLVVLNYRFWRSHFGGDRDVLGKTLTLDNFGIPENYIIIGVMPEGFDFPYPFANQKPDYWSPLYLPARFVPGNHLSVVARLKPGVKIGQARAELASLGEQLRSQYAKYFAHEYFEIAPLTSELVRDVKTVIWTLLAALGSVLLVGCSNIGCLLLVHANRRQNEMAVRSALGASQFDLIRKMSTETLLLAVFGGALGLALADGGMRVVTSLLPRSLYIPRLNTVALDTRLLVFSAVLSALVALAFGILPALKFAKPNITEELKASDVNPGRRGLLRRSGSVLIVCEVCLALVLATTTLMLTKGVRRFLDANAEYQPEQFLSLDISFTNSYVKRTRNLDDLAPVMYSQFRRKVGAMPGVRSVIFLDGFPMGSTDDNYNRVKETGGEGLISENFQPSGVHVVDPSFIDWAKFEIVQGRWLSSTDGPKDLPVAVINSAMARRYFPNGHAIGAQIEPMYRYTDERKLYTVVGVIQEPKRFGTGLDAAPAIFMSMPQLGMGVRTALIRTSGNATQLTNAVREAALAIVPGETSVTRLQTGEAFLSESTARVRVLSWLLSSFSGLAFVLVLVGTYALVSYDTARRTREVGIRMALGASPAHVKKMVALGTAYPVIVGVVLGALSAYAFARTLASLLYEVSPADTGSFAIGVLAIVAVALAASNFPARRASRIDPLAALRHE